MLTCPFKFDKQASCRFQLEKGTAKTQCPQCHKKDFKRYVDAETGQIVANDIGRCNRSDKCGYHRKPTKGEYQGNYFSIHEMKTPTIGELPIELLDLLKPHEGVAQTIFDHFNGRADMWKVKRVLNSYRIVDYRGFAAIPFIDRQGKLRFVQMKQYDREFHTISGSTTALHRYALHNNPKGEWKEIFETYDKSDIKVSCYFGVHRLQGNDNIIFVESPKTAVLGQILTDGLQQGIKWVAAGAKDWINADKTLQMRDAAKIIMIPDASMPNAVNGSTAYREWAAAMQRHIKPTCHNAKVQLLNFDDLCTEQQRKQGYDIADMFWDSHIANTADMLDTFVRWFQQ
jgi:hypothetical protein